MIPLLATLLDHLDYKIKVAQLIVGGDWSVGADHQLPFDACSEVHMVTCIHK